MGSVGDPGLDGGAGGFAPALGLSLTRRSTSELACPKAMVGRVIGKNGETIKALQTYTGALIQIDQSTEPTRVTVSGNVQSLSLAVSMITDICKGTFKGFALLRQLTQQQRGISSLGGPTAVQPRPVYAPGYGLIPPSQLQTGGFQYMPGTAAQGLGQAGAAPMLLGLPSMQAHRPLGQPGLGLQMQAPQLQMPQVYSAMPMAAAPFATQLAYYPTPDYNSGEGLLLQQPDGTVTFQPTAATSGAKLMGQAGGMRPRMAGHNAPHNAFFSKVDLPGAMGQSAVGELLGQPSGGAQHQPGSTSSLGAGAGGQSLVQVVDQEGKVSFYAYE